MNVNYHATRCVAGAVSPHMPATVLLCLISFEMPDGKVHSMVIPEDKILEQCKGDLVKEELYIQSELKKIAGSMMAGANRDHGLIFKPELKPTDD